VLHKTGTDKVIAEYAKNVFSSVKDSVDVARGRAAVNKWVHNVAGR